MDKQDILRVFGNNQFVEIYLETEATTLAYDRHFKYLMDQTPLQPGHRVLDVGTAFGPPSLALFRKQPDIQVVAMDPVEDMLAISKALFTGEGIKELLLKYAHNIAVLTYLANMYQECSRFGSQISYVQSFAEDIDRMNIGQFDHILGSLSLHWLLDPEKAFSNFNIALKTRGTVSISSDAWKYKMSRPDFRNDRKISDAPFMRTFYRHLDTLVGVQEGSPQEEPNDLEKVERLLSKTGFKLIGYEERKVPISLGHMLMSCKASAFYRNLGVLGRVSGPDLVEIVREALSRTLDEINPLDSVGNYYGMSPYILARKIS